MYIILTVSLIISIYLILENKVLKQSLKQSKIKNKTLEAMWESGQRNYR